MTEWSGRTTLHSHKFKDWESKPVEPNASPGVKKVYLLDAQWSTCPVEVENQVKDLWKWADLGNDNSYFRTSIEELEEELSYDAEQKYPVVEVFDDEKKDWVEKPLDLTLIVKYLREQGVSEKDPVLIHWWW